MGDIYSGNKMNDKQIIFLLGGPTKVSDLLGYSKKKGPQRVWNWTVRGIPAQVKLDNLELFKQNNQFNYCQEKHWLVLNGSSEKDNQ